MSTCHKDQLTYSTATVEEYLPSVWDAEWILQPRLRREAATGLKSKVDPRHIPDHLLTAADVQVGFRRARLSHAEKECLRHVHHLGFPPGELASYWGVLAEDVHKTCMTGVTKIANYLSGRTPQ
jgi:hypothetical protein